MKQNCWDFKKCGREVGGVKVRELGICPAATEKRLNGIHEGRNAGRCCWVVAGTLCDGEIQGIFADKKGTCIECDFYKKVRSEEGLQMIYSTQLFDKIND